MSGTSDKKWAKCLLFNDFCVPQNAWDKVGTRLGHGTGRDKTMPARDDRAGKRKKHVDPNDRVVIVVSGSVPAGPTGCWLPAFSVPNSTADCQAAQAERSFRSFSHLICPVWCQSRD